MSLYRIAGITVDMQPKYERLLKQSLPYAIGEGKAQMHLSLSDEFLARKQKENPHLSLADCEYIWYGSAFYHKLLGFGGMLLHSSCVAVDGNAYLFSASSGTGKSTHTELWQKKFGDRLIFINDDKPALRTIDGTVCACGTPFSGKTDRSTAVCVPLRAICILERGETNSISRISSSEALPKILNQTIRPCDRDAMLCMLDVLNRILDTVPVYRLFCNMEEEAATVSYEAMKYTV